MKDDPGGAAAPRQEEVRACPMFGECWCEHPAVTQGRTVLAAVKLAERGTGWVDDDAITRAHAEALLAFRRLMQAFDGCTHMQLTAQSQALAALVKQWQLIETAPKDGRLILVSGRGWGAFGNWHVDRWYTQWAWQGARPLVDGKRSVDPTHWMPLPEPPGLLSRAGEKA